MKHALLLLATTTLWTDRLPPERFQHDTYATTFFVGMPTLEALCSGNSAPASVVVVGCTRTMNSGAQIIVLPNPCLLGKEDYYAQIVCHEMGHTEGWPADHPD